MRLIQFKSNDGGEIDRFEEGLKMAKEGIMDVCEIWEDMKEQFSERRGGYSERGSYGERYGERGGYGERGNYGERGGYYRRDEREWDEMQERRRRDGRGRYM